MSIHLHDHAGDAPPVALSTLRKGDLAVVLGIEDGREGLGLGSRRRGGSWRWGRSAGRLRCGPAAGGNQSQDKQYSNT